jgi:hypothetical protein
MVGRRTAAVREKHTYGWDRLLFFAASDIILETAAEKQNPDRAAQFYANNSARVMVVRPGGKGAISQANIAWSEKKGVAGVPSPLYYNGRLYTFQNCGIIFCRAAKTGELGYSGRLGAPGYYYSSPVAADASGYELVARSDSNVFRQTVRRRAIVQRFLCLRSILLNP